MQRGNGADLKDTVKHGAGHLTKPPASQSEQRSSVLLIHHHSCFSPTPRL